MSGRNQQHIDGITVGIFIADAGTEEVEFTEPQQAVSDAGAEVVVIGTESDEAQTVNNDLEESNTYAVDKTFGDVSPVATEIFWLNLLLSKCTFLAAYSRT